MADDTDLSRRDVMRAGLAVGAAASGLVPAPAGAVAAEPARRERVQDLIDRIAAIRLTRPRIHMR
jgi:hypothetical protein